MRVYENYRTDPTLEKDGVWFDMPSYRIKLGRAGGANKKYTATFERLCKPHKRKIQSDALDEKTAKNILVEAYAREVVKDWHVIKEKNGEPVLDDKGEEQWVRGIHGLDGSILPFNPENVKEILTDVPDLFLDIKDVADNYTSYLAIEEEGSEKNSRTVLSGK